MPHEVGETMFGNALKYLGTVNVHGDLIHSGANQAHTATPAGVNRCSGWKIAHEAVVAQHDVCFHNGFPWVNIDQVSCAQRKLLLVFHGLGCVSSAWRIRLRVTPPYFWLC